MASSKKSSFKNQSFENGSNCGHCKTHIPYAARFYHDAGAQWGKRTVCCSCAHRTYGLTDPDPDAKPRPYTKRKSHKRPYSGTATTSPPWDPTPVEPTPVEPTPVEPTPVEPTPVEPTPVEPVAESVTGGAAKISAALIEMLAALESKVESLSAGLTVEQIRDLIRQETEPRKTITKLEIAREGNVEVVFEPGTYHPKFPLILKILSNPVRKKFVYITGGAGGGKSHIAEQLAKALGVPFYSLGSPQNEFAMSGYRTATGVYVDTQFRQAFEHGGLILIDEIDASLARAILYLNPALSNGYLDFPDGKVKQHKDFYLVCGANTIGNGATRRYVGRNALDKSTLDRFCYVHLDYSDELERNLAQNDSWVSKVQAYRAASEELGYDLVISPRASINGADLIADGIPESEVEEICIWKGTDSETVAKIKQLARR